MRPIWRALLAALVLVPALAIAGMNRTFLVPAYKPCPDGETTCLPQGPESTFTFDQVVLKTSQRPFIGPEQVSLVIELKGVRDAAGNLVTTDRGNAADDFVLLLPPGRVTLLAGTQLQLEPGSPLVPTARIRIDLRNGKGKVRYTTPPETPARGLINQTIGVPILYDNQGHPLAVTGARSKP